MALAALLTALLAAVPPLVVTTTQDLAAIASAVAGSELRVEYLVPGIANTHDVELKPSYALKLAKSDAVVRVGLGLDDWSHALVENSRNARLKPGAPGNIDASEGCSLMDVPTGEVDRSMGDVHPYGNPHYLLDPENGLTVARSLGRRFGALWPDRKAVFDSGVARFERDYAARRAQWSPLLDKVRGMKVVSYHRMWGYFARFSGIEPVGELEPKPGIPPTANHTRALVEKMQTESVRIIIREPFYEMRTPESVARLTGARIVTLAPQVGALPDAGDYLAMFDTNLRLLAEAVGN